MNDQAPSEPTYTVAPLSLAELRFLWWCVNNAEIKVEIAEAIVRFKAKLPALPEEG